MSKRLALENKYLDPVITLQQIDRIRKQDLCKTIIKSRLICFVLYEVAHRMFTVSKSLEGSSNIFVVAKIAQKWIKSRHKSGRYRDTQRRFPP